MPESPTEPLLPKLVLKDGDLRCSKCGGTELRFMEMYPYSRPVLGFKNGTIFISDDFTSWGPDDSQDCIDCGKCLTEHRVPARDEYKFKWDNDAWEEANFPRTQCVAPLPSDYSMRRGYRGRHVCR